MSSSASDRRCDGARAGTSRRQFLETALAGAGLALTGAAARARVPVGGHPWVYAATQPGYEITPVLDAIFADMAYAGLDGVELMHSALRPDDAVERIGRLTDQHGLPVIGASFDGAMWDRTRHAAVLEDARKVVPRLAHLGGRTLGVSVGAAPAPKSPEQLDAQAELLRTLTTLCADQGIVLNLHNHTYEVENGLHDLKGTLARLPDAKLGPDLNWLLRGGVDPAAFIREYGARIVFLHLRDQQADGRWSEALGEGSMDYPAIASALREVGFQGTAVIELAHERDFTPTRPLRESLKQSRSFVRETLGY